MLRFIVGLIVFVTVMALGSALFGIEPSLSEGALLFAAWFLAAFAEGLF